MHRLRNKKKNKEDGETESNGGGGGLLSGKSFKRTKNAPAPVKPMLDLATALPPTDDFRTSLLMPNLAQRFSILAQEQSGQNSLAERPSAQTNGNSKGDDLSSFNFSSFTPSGGLSDIAETGSIAGSLGGNYGLGSAQSRDSHDSDEQGGMMNRSRPGEGNVLFGGRQKVYRVVGNSSGRASSDDVREGGGSMGGRVYYDNDVPVSTFAAAKKAYNYGDEDTEQFQATPERPYSPPTAQNNDNNRNTSSSTNSTPTNFTRSSTAATSVNSQHPSTSGPSSSSPNIGTGVNTMLVGKPRRPLYEQALDQQAHEQQNMFMLNQRKYGTMSPPLITDRNSPVDNYMQSGSHAGTPSPNTERHNFYDNVHNEPTPISTPVGGLAKFNFGLDTKGNGYTTTAESASPTSEREKKPTGYDDERYHLMQQQKIQLREPSPPAHIEQATPITRDAPKLSLSPTRISILSVSSEDSKGGLDWDKLSISPRSSHGEDFREQEKRKSEAESHQTFLSTPSSDESSDYEDYDARDSFDERVRMQRGVGLGLQEAQDEEELKAVSPLRPNGKASRPSTADSDRYSVASTIDQNTANNELAPELDLSNFKFGGDMRPLSPLSPHLVAKEEDSPTLPPIQGLSVMVRQHLRSDSGRSSIYTTRSRMSRNIQDRSSTAGYKASIYGPGKLGGVADAARPSGASGSSGGNVWEFDDWDGGYYGEDLDSPTAAIHPALRKQSIQSVESAVDKGRDLQSESQTINDEWNGYKEPTSDGSGQLSSDDDQDRDWEDQIAHRKKLVQQNLREHESRSSSPVPEFAKDQRPRSPGPGALDMLRKKTSNGMLSRDEGNKAMRMLGINSSEKRDEHSREEERLRETVRGAKNIPLQAQRPPLPPQHPVHPYHQNQQDRDYRQGAPVSAGRGPRQNFPQPNMASQPPPHLDDHPAMRPRQHPMRPGPNGPPLPGRSPMRGPSLRNMPSREYMQNSEQSPRLMSPPRSGDPRWRDDQHHDGNSPPQRSPNPNSPNSGMHNSPRTGGPLRTGPPMHGQMNGHGNGMEGQNRRMNGPQDGYERRMNGHPEGHDRRMNGYHPEGPERRMNGNPDGRRPEHMEGRMGGPGPMARPTNGPPMTRNQGPMGSQMSRTQSDAQGRGIGNQTGNHMGRAPSDANLRGRMYPEDRHRDGPRMMNGNRGMNEGFGEGVREQGSGRSDERGPGQAPYSPETSPPPTGMRSRGNSNAQPPLNRARSESVLRRENALPPIQTSPPRVSPAPLMLNISTPTVEKSPMLGRSPGPFQGSPFSTTPSTPATSMSSSKFLNSPNPGLHSPALSSNSPSAPTSAHLAKIQSFQNMNAPAAKKRVVDKSKISEPKLIASTSNIPTKALPPQSPTPPLSAPQSASSAGARKRRQTTTNIFGSFGKNSSAEKMPQHHGSDGEVERSSFTMDEPKKEKVRGKLRKSTSDGGGLSARARKDADKNAPATPVIPQTMMMSNVQRQGMI